MKMNTRYTAAFVIILLVLGIGGAKSLGLWEAESDKLPALINEGEFAGMSDPEDIRGSYSFGDIAASFDVTPEIIAEAFDIVTDVPADFQCKMLEDYYPDMPEDLELGTGAVKQFVALYTGLPYEGEDGFPSTAIPILEREGKWSEELAVMLHGRIIHMDTLVVATDEPPAETEDPEEAHEDEMSVNGNTTVTDVMAWGLSLEEVEEALGVSVVNKNMTIRDICSQNGLTFSSVKDSLNGMLEE